MRRFIIVSTMFLVLGLAARSQAALDTFDLTYSGSSFGNSAVGNGTITIDTSLVYNPGDTDTHNVPFVTAFSLTISGATKPSDDGTFGLADFGEIFLDTDGATLDFSQQLVGQPGFGPGSGGDFNFFSNGSDPSAPTGFNFFTIETGNGNGDFLELTSFAPAVTPPAGGGSAVPLPSSLALGLVSLGILAFAIRRRTFRTCDLA